MFIIRDEPQNHVDGGVAQAVHYKFTHTHQTIFLDDLGVSSLTFQGYLRHKVFKDVFIQLDLCSVAYNFGEEENGVPQYKWLTFMGYATLTSSMHARSVCPNFSNN